MGLVLKILGAIFLGLILALVFAFFVVRAKVRRFLKNLEQMAGGLTPQPLELELEQIVGDVEWTHPDEVKAIQAALRDQGFHSLGVFQTEAMGHIQIEGWSDHDRSIVAALYEHPGVDRPVLDYVRRFEDGHTVTSSNAPTGGELDLPPQKTKFFEPELGPEELLRKLMAFDHPSTPMPAPGTGSEFKQIFERAYAEEMEWRVSRGGPTLQEVRAVALASGDENEENILATHRALQAQALEQLDGVLRHRFQKSTPMSVSEWEDVEHRLVFIHDRLTPDRLNDLVEPWLEESEDENEENEADPLRPFDEDGEAFSPRLEFARFNQSLPQGRQFRQIGELDQPVETDVYSAPAYDDHE